MVTIQVVLLMLVVLAEEEAEEDGLTDLVAAEVE